jgi:uncharacterized protein YukE
MANSGTDYSGWTWQQISDAIQPGSPSSLSAAASVFSGLQQSLASISQSLQGDIGNLTGSWHGPAADAFTTAANSLVTAVQALGDVVSGNGGAGALSDLLNENSAKLTWAQGQVQSIDSEAAHLAAKAGAPVSPTGLVTLPGSATQHITQEMIPVIQALAADYEKTISALQAVSFPASSSPSPSSGTSAPKPQVAIATPVLSPVPSSINNGNGSGSGSGTSTPKPQVDIATPSASPAVSSPSNDDSSGDNSWGDWNTPAPVSGGPATHGGPATPKIDIATSSAGPAIPATGGTSDWISKAFSVLEAHGVPASHLNANAVNIIIQHESGGNPNAINLTDSNAAAGDPSQGLMQTTGQTFSAYALPGYNSNIDDPVSNIIAAVRYALATYGSLNNVPGVVSVDGGGPYMGY